MKIAFVGAGIIHAIETDAPFRFHGNVPEAARSLSNIASQRLVVEAMGEAERPCLPPS